MSNNTNLAKEAKCTITLPSGKSQDIFHVSKSELGILARMKLKQLGKALKSEEPLKAEFFEYLCNSPYMGYRYLWNGGKDIFQTIAV